MRSVISDDALLEKGLRDLAEAWAAAGDGWRDQAHADFASLHLEPMTARAGLGLRTVRELETLLGQAVDQCS